MHLRLVAILKSNAHTQKGRMEKSRWREIPKVNGTHTKCEIAKKRNRYFFFSFVIVCHSLARAGKAARKQIEFFSLCEMNKFRARIEKKADNDNREKIKKRKCVVSAFTVNESQTPSTLRCMQVRTAG